MVQTIRSNSRLFLIGACFGLFSGLAEGAVYWILSVKPDGLGWKNDLVPQIFWIAPIVNLLGFLLVSLVVILLHRLFPKISKDFFACAVFGWLGTYAPLSASGKLHPIACVLLALGVAVQLCRYARRQPVTNVFLGRSLAALSMAVVLVSISGQVFEVQRKILSKPVAGTRASSPNVLLITLDTLRADHLSSYGYSRPTTPNIDRLARDGVLFENAFAESSWTLPSHATIMTGRFTYEHKAGGSPLSDRYPTLAQFLSSKGYATAGFVANTFYCGPRTGLNRGFAQYQAYFGTVADMISRTFYGELLLDKLPLVGYYDIPGRKRAADVNQEFLRWLEKNRQAPFFVFLNYLDTHDPYIPAAGSQRRFSQHSTPGTRINSLLFPRDFTGGRRLSKQEVQTEIDGYDDSLAYLDAELGSLFGRLKVMNLLDNTLIILTADHGESFGDHGLYGHGNSLYNNLLHVPLIVRYPGSVPAGVRVSQAVSLQTIAATVVNMLGFVSNSPFSGESLARYWSEDSASISKNSDFAIAESLPGIVENPAYPLGRRSAMKSVSTSKWHLILYEEGKAELFRIDRDPAEANNVAHAPESEEVLRRLGSKLAESMTAEDWKIFGPVIAPYLSPQLQSRAKME